MNYGFFGLDGVGDERERETEGHKRLHWDAGKHKETQKDTKRHKETQRDTKRHKETQRDTERHRETVRQRETKRYSQNGFFSIRKQTIII